MHDGHLTTLKAPLEHVVLRWAKKKFFMYHMKWKYSTSLYSLGFSEKQTGTAEYFFWIWLMDWVFEFSEEMIYGQDQLWRCFISKAFTVYF